MTGRYDTVGSSRTEDFSPSTDSSETSRGTYILTGDPKYFINSLLSGNLYGDVTENLTTVYSFIECLFSHFHSFGRISHV
jgi:hypothetical protein